LINAVGVIVLLQTVMIDYKLYLVTPGIGYVKAMVFA